MAEITSLREAVSGLVRDGDLVAMEGFTHLIPFAAGHEIIRQGRMPGRVFNFIQKPFTAQVLASRLAEILAQPATFVA